LNTDGTGFKTLYNFTSLINGTDSSGGEILTNSDGAGPMTGLILSGNTLYGTTLHGGAAGSGTIFSISLPPQLTITPVGPNVILAWPTNTTGYSLQTTSNLLSPAWTTNLPVPSLVNEQYVVTNAISGTPQFFRLIQ